MNGLRGFFIGGLNADFQLNHTLRQGLQCADKFIGQPIRTAFKMEVGDPIVMLLQIRNQSESSLWIRIECTIDKFNLFDILFEKSIHMGKHLIQGTNPHPIAVLRR